MALFSSVDSLSSSWNGAHAVWRSTREEQKALVARKHLEELKQVDQIWYRLAEKYSEIIAVDAPYSSPPETFTYGQLADFIHIVSN